MYNYALLEERLSRLLKSLAHIFSSSETSEVQEFLDAGEYGLALETICGIITEEHKVVEIEVVKQIEELRDTMQLESEIVTEFLHGRRTEGA